MENNTDDNCRHEEESENISYSQSDALQLTDTFISFRSKCKEIYESDPVYFLSAS